jgi:hypothetical protein
VRGQEYRQKRGSHDLKAFQGLEMEKKEFQQIISIQHVCDKTEVHLRRCKSWARETWLHLGWAVLERCCQSWALKKSQWDSLRKAEVSILVQLVNQGNSLRRGLEEVEGSWERQEKDKWWLHYSLASAWLPRLWTTSLSPGHMRGMAGGHADTLPPGDSSVMGNAV